MISSVSEHRAARPLFFFVLSLCFFSLQCILTTSSPAAENFPLYPSIRTNVKFWEDVYSRYSTRQGILHDRTNLGRVYAVIDLVDWKALNAEKTNNERIDVAKNRINATLTRLGSGIPPRTAEERRIASLFPKQRQTTYHEAKENIRLQIGQSDRFQEGIIRSGRYIPQFRQIFASHGLPPELVYLPHVESSFNPKAYSKAGAAGLWQFTRSTGKEYMTINELVDERYDPYLSTESAAQFLKENHKQLKTWPLALTAYNYGRAGMVRAVKEKGSYENIFKSYDKGQFKFAARNFYSEFLAAMLVAKRAAGNPKIPFERPEVIVSLRLKEDVPIGRLRSSLRISAENFARLNPALRNPVLNGEQAVPKGYLARLPAAKQEKTNRTL